MTAPTVAVRKAVYQRDGYRCVTCGTTDNLTFQHRKASGMGNANRNAPGAVDGLTACLECNTRYEADLQTTAYGYGWKLKWNPAAAEVPVYVPMDQQWYRLEGTQRVRITAVVAHQLMSAAYGWETWIRWFQEAKS